MLSVNRDNLPHFCMAIKEVSISLVSDFEINSLLHNWTVQRITFHIFWVILKQVSTSMYVAFFKKKKDIEQTFKSCKYGWFIYDLCILSFFQKLSNKLLNCLNSFHYVLPYMTSHYVREVPRAWGRILEIQILIIRVTQVWTVLVAPSFFISQILISRCHSGQKAFLLQVQIKYY